MIAVVDYGVGNLANVARALRRAGADDVRITGDEVEILGARAVVLPGVGHFGHCSRELSRRGLDATIHESRRRGQPLLGLCVGMQLLFDASDEDNGATGLGVFSGRVRRISGPVRVPHTGWNTVRRRAAHPWLADVPDDAHFYFVHSYAAAPDHDVVLATTQYGAELPAIVGGDEVLGVQFHPEKSSRMGQRLLEGFVRGIGA